MQLFREPGEMNTSGDSTKQESSLCGKLATITNLLPQEIEKKSNLVLSILSENAKTKLERLGDIVVEMMPVKGKVNVILSACGNKLPYFTHKVFLSLKNQDKLTSERTKFVDEFIGVAEDKYTREEFEVIVRLLCTYKDSGVKKVELDNILKNLLKGDFSFLIEIFEIKKNILLGLDINGNQDNLDEVIEFATQYKQMLNIIFPLCSFLSKNNEITSSFGNFIKILDEVSTTLLSYIQKKEEKIGKHTVAEKEKFELFKKTFYEIIDQLIFLGVYFGQNVDYYEFINRSLEGKEVNVIKKEIDYFFDDELKHLYDAVEHFDKYEKFNNDKRKKLLDSIVKVKIAKNTLNRFFMYELVESEYSLSKVAILSPENSFNLSRKQKLQKKNAVFTLVAYYNRVSGCSQCRSANDIISDFIKRLDLNDPKIETLISIVYDILFYNYINDVELKIHLQTKLSDKKEKGVSFYMRKQIDNILTVFIYKEHYGTPIVIKGRKYNEELLKIAINDVLTESYNRRFLMEYLFTKFIEEIREKNKKQGKKDRYDDGEKNANQVELPEGTEQEETNYAIIQIDLDDFKTINDELGHDTGDDVLKKFAKIMNSILREGDYLIRTGGDEFCALVLVKDKEGLDSLCKRICNIVKSNLSQGITGNLAHFTVSIGALYSPKRFSDSSIKIEEIIPTIEKVELKSVDKIMYKSKNTGKSRYTIGEE